MIYIFTYDTNEERPEIDMWHKLNRRISFAYNDYLVGRITKKPSRTPNFTVDHPLALEWDIYKISGCMPIVSKCLRDFMIENCRGSIDCIPVYINEMEYYAVLVNNVVDCLNVADSEIKWVDVSQQRAMFIDKYAFDFEKIAPVDIFTIPQLHKGDVFCTQIVKDRGLSANFNGVEFLDLPR